MTDASSTPEKAKRRLPRNPHTGTFEAPSPLNDPAILEAAVNWVRSIDKLHPLFEAIAKANKKQDPQSFAVHQLLADVLAGYRQVFLQQLSMADDPEPYRRAKLKPMGHTPHRFAAAHQFVEDSYVSAYQGGDAAKKP